MGDVLDGEVARQEGVDHDGRRRGHERADEIEGPDTALNQLPGPAPGSDHRRHSRIAASDERGKNQKGAQGGHRAYDPAMADFEAASYFDGHFATTPFGTTWNPFGPSFPRSTTSASGLNVSGTIPV